MRSFPSPLFYEQCIQLLKNILDNIIAVHLKLATYIQEKDYFQNQVFSKKALSSLSPHQDQYVFLNQCVMDIIRSQKDKKTDLIYQNMTAMAIYENVTPGPGFGKANGYHA